VGELASRTGCCNLNCSLLEQMF